jgi:diguanylate cyclase (GGDEF)-like protein
MVNETVGHAAGDRIIVSISKVLSGCVREGDLLARTGGDEFSILLPKRARRRSTQS